MKMICCTAVILQLFVAGVAEAQTVHELSATSSVRVEITQDGNIVMQTHNTRLVPYVLYDRDQNNARLAEITTDVRSRSDAEGTDPASVVSFRVKDLSGEQPKQLSSFSDPGAIGKIIGERYAVATMPGCCGGATIHHVRALETGRSLFRSTGDAIMGTAAWAEAPNAKPRTVRWAAYDGDVSASDARAGLLGRLAYGNDEGELSVIELRTRSPNEDLALGLSHSAVLRWVDPKASRNNGPPASGTADFPESIWAIEGIADRVRLGGFQLVLTLDRQRLIEIPIIGDQFAVSKAKTAASMTVRAAPR